MWVSPNPRTAAAASLGSSSMKKAATVAVILLVLAGTGVVGARYTWFRAWRPAVTSNGVPIPGARIYRNWSGDILLDLRPASGDLYVVRKSMLKVGIPSSSSVVENPAVVFSRHYPLLIVNLESEKAGAIHPNLTLTSEKLSFVGTDRKTIQVSWR